MNRSRDQRIIAVGFLPITAIGLLGGMFLPQLMPVWTVMIGLTTGMMLPVALGLISERAATAGDAARMSGMAQSIGYFCAGLGPIIGGGLFEATGGWTATLGLLLACVTARSARHRPSVKPPAPSGEDTGGKSAARGRLDQVFEVEERLVPGRDLDLREQALLRVGVGLRERLGLFEGLDVDDDEAADGVAGLVALRPRREQARGVLAQPREVLGAQFEALVDAVGEVV
jgi:MFS family permease